MTHRFSAVSVLLGLVASLAMAVAPARAAERAPLSVVVVLDTSGSMAEAGHDPKEISKFAVEVLAHFLDDADRLGVVPLGAATETVGVAPVGGLRGTLGDRLAALQYGGGTPCAERLRVASGLLLGSRPAAGTASLVFLTDGVCDPVEDKTGEKRQAIARELRDAGMPIFGIPLGAAADLAAVRQLSAGAELEWTVERVDQARQLPALFARLSAALRHTEARVLALGRGAQSLELDPYLRSVTLLVTVDGGPVSLRGLRDPSGDAIAAAPVEGIFPRGEKRKAESSGYSLLKLVAPEAGTWSLDVKAASDPSAIVVYDYDLRAVLSSPDAAAVKPGGTATLAATLETPSGEPVAAGFLKDASVSLQARAPSDAEWRDLGAMRWDGVAAFVADAPVGEFGRHRFRARVQRGKSLDLRTYAEVIAVPGLNLAAPADGCLASKGPSSFAATLDPPPRDGAAAGALDVRLWAAGPGDAQAKPVAALPWDPDRQAFAGSWTPPAAGTWHVEARLQGGPGVASQSAVVGSERVDYHLELDTAPLDFGSFKAGDEREVSAAWTQASVSHPLTATIDTASATLPEGASLAAPAAPLNPNAVAPLSLKLLASADSPGGTVGGDITVHISGRCLPPPGLAFTVPLRANIVPLTFWEKLWRFWQLHRALVITLALLALALLYLLLLAICASRTHSFDPHVQILRSDNPHSFPGSRPIVSFSGTRRRVLIPLRCRSARLYWNSPVKDFGATHHPTWYLQAGPNNGIRLVAPKGFDIQATSTVTMDFQPIEVPRDIARGMIYKVGETHFKIE